MFESVDLDEALKLDHQLCFVLYALSRRMTQLYRPLLEPLGLTYPQYLVMLVLWEHDRQAGDAGQGMSVKLIGERLMLDTGTLTPLLKRLQTHGLIQRNRSEQDERTVLILLTEQGRDLRNKAKSVPVQMLCQSGIPIEQLAQVREQLKVLLENLAK